MRQPARARPPTAARPRGRAQAARQTLVTGLRVLLVDDQPLFVDAMGYVLSQHGCAVVGSAHDGFEAVEQARALKPDLILMDDRMPICDGIVATRLIKAELPDIDVVMLADTEGGTPMLAAVQAGACGYLLKTQSAEEVVELLAGLASGDIPLAPGCGRRLLDEIARTARQPGSPPPPAIALTARQAQVLTLVARGMRYKEIARQLLLSERTVKYHMGRIRARLQCRTRVQLVDYARSHGLLGSDPRPPSDRSS
jgi:DNA-binding NarL/FixJ family response regulator